MGKGQSSSRPASDFFVDYRRHAPKAEAVHCTLFAVLYVSASEQL